MSPLEVIKSGILNGDLNLVTEGYNSLTGESIAPNILLGSDSKINLVNNLKKVLDDWAGSPVVDLIEIDKQSTKKTRGRKPKLAKRVNKKLDVDDERVIEQFAGNINNDSEETQFPFQELYDPEKAQECEEKKIVKNKRKPYVANMVKCSCGKMFDSNKIITTKEGNTEPKCNKCQLKQMPSNRE